MSTYKTPIVAVLEYGLVAAILFHALNGLRVIAVDFWSKGPRYQKQMLWSVVVLWLVLMIGAIYPSSATPLVNCSGADADVHD
ncbi:hypothetical protein SAV31267_060280 [Streptomyces avermitilis]|uniref:Succinate dehydrogenase, cytochrome b556 subunit n=1 Tax=Streptomyces avermitilis TaxID=33903 RepID=A0A4D4MWN9_STRAX|nr:hypothetical protein SAV31267_060280 [Streptomyces avermitilis]